MGVMPLMFVKIRRHWLTEKQVSALSSLLRTKFDNQEVEVSIVKPVVDEYSDDSEFYEWLLGTGLEPYMRVMVQDIQDPQPYIIAAIHEQFLRVNLPTIRLGDNWPLVFDVAEFLESYIPRCEVWWGEDGSGMYKRLEKADRQMMV